MRLLQLNEADETAVSESSLKALFDIEGTIEITPDGVNVDGDVFSKEGKRLKTIPVKFGQVTGKFDMSGNNTLETLENFPDRAKIVRIAWNTVLTDLTGGSHITCETFDAKGSVIETLNECPTAVNYNFHKCEKLTSTEGLPIDKLQSINLAECPNITNIKNIMTKIPNSKVLTKSKIRWNEDLPLIWLVTNSGREGYLNFEIEFPSNADVLKSIVNDYQGKGLGVALEFVRALRDHKLTSNSRLR